MKLSARGLTKIKGYEGYHRRLSDGRCMAYRCPAGVWTIGYGCTEGVREGMIWTAADAEARLLTEIAKHEAAVLRLVTVEINQNEFDALVSFSYNVGSGALAKSTLLRKLNGGDVAGAGNEFAKWTRGGGKVLPGLVHRRASEKALFLETMTEPEPNMPQRVEESSTVTGEAKSLSSSGTIWGAVAAGGAATANYLDDAFKSLLEAVGAMTQLEPLKALGGNHKSLALGLGVFAVVLVISRRIKARAEGIN